MQFIYKIINADSVHKINLCAPASKIILNQYNEKVLSFTVVSVFRFHGTFNISLLKTQIFPNRQQNFKKS